MMTLTDNEVRKMRECLGTARAELLHPTRRNRAYNAIDRADVVLSRAERRGSSQLRSIAMTSVPGWAPRVIVSIPDVGDVELVEQ